MPSFLWGADEFPSLLDHVILGCNDLDAGIRFVQERTGVRAAPGGVHPDRGTSNALLSLGDRHYLEIMAPDPNAKEVQAWAARQLKGLKALANPRLMGWAVHPRDIDSTSPVYHRKSLILRGTDFR
jgi:Glyoxalase-like domain